MRSRLIDRLGDHHPRARVLAGPLLALSLGACGDADGEADAAVLDASVLDTAVPTDGGTGDAFAQPADAAMREDDAPIGTTYGPAVALGDLTGVPETSGIVASRDHAHVFWVHNDSGNPAEIFAIDESARVLATITLDGATNADWEDIGLVPVDGVDLLYVGDHGDNLARTSGGTSSFRDGTIRLYRIEEPDPAAGDAHVTATPIVLTYPDGPHDCEGMLVDPGSADVYLFTKVDTGTAHVYRGTSLSLSAPNVLEHVATIDMSSITGADMSSDGVRLALRSYTQIRVYTVDRGDVAGALTGTPLRPSSRGSAAEAIAFSPAGYDLYTIAEGDPATLFHIPWE